VKERRDWDEGTERILKKIKGYLTNKGRNKEKSDVREA